MDRDKSSSKNNSLPDISGIFDIDESKIPDKLISKREDGGHGRRGEPILTSPEAERFLPEEEQKKLNREKKTRLRAVKISRRKTRVNAVLAGIIVIFLLAGIIRARVADSKKPTVSLEKPAVGDITQSRGANGIAAEYGGSGAAVFIDNDYDVHAVRVGLPAEITVGGAVISGRVAEIKELSPHSPLVGKFFELLTDKKPQTPVCAVYVVPDDTVGLGPEGTRLSVKVKIKTAANALTVPTAALGMSGTQYFVWIYRPFRNTLRRQDVSVGISADGRTQITAGVKKSDSIAVSFSCGRDKIYDGMKVKKD